MDILRTESVDSGRPGNCPFGIALIICMLPVHKTGGSFFRKYSFVIAAEVVILTGIVLFVIGIVKAWPMLI